MSVAIASVVSYAGGAMGARLAAAAAMAAAGSGKDGSGRDVRCHDVDECSGLTANESSSSMNRSRGKTRDKQ